MQHFEFTTHAANMLLERNIDREWVFRAIAEPTKIETMEDGTTHYLRPVPEHGGRILRVVTDLKSRPNHVITVFFDRRMKGKL